MEERLAFKDGIQIGWDSTSITMATACLRKYQYSMLEGWRYPDISRHLIFGRAYASALENFHKARAAGADFEEGMRIAIRVGLTECWLDEKDKDGNDVKVLWDSEDDKKNLYNLIRSIVWYLDHFKEDTTKTVILSNGQAAVEYTFNFVPEGDLIFSGHIDRLVEFNGDLYVQDQKTTGGNLTAKFYREFESSIQFSMYTLAGKMILNNPVEGVMIDAAKVAVGFTEFGRGFSLRTNPILEEWLENTLDTVYMAQEVTAEYRATGKALPMNRTACNDYGGCPFASICNINPNHRLSFLKEKFIKTTGWDALEAR